MLELAAALCRMAEGDYPLRWPFIWIDELVNAFATESEPPPNDNRGFVEHQMRKQHGIR